MHKLTISTYRIPKWEWFDFVGFSGPRDSNYLSTYGWSVNGYAQATGINRSVGARLVRGTDIIETGTAFTELSINKQYLQFNSLSQNGDKVQIKYNPKNIIRFWYRYAGINQILFDVNECLNLTEISLRRNNIHFGNWDLSNLSKLQVFEISRNAGISSLILNASAPIKLFYVQDTPMPQAVINEIILQAYNRGLTGGQILNDVMPSDSLCDECDILINQRGWSITTYPVCVSNEPTTAWRGIDPICEKETFPPEIGELRLLETDSMTASLEWDPATDSDGTIQNYEIWAYNPDWGNYMLMATVSGSTLSHIFTELETGSYTFMVRAIDDDGLYSGNSNTVYTNIIPGISEGVNNEDLPNFTFDSNWVLDDTGAIANNHDGSFRTYTENTIPTGGLWSVENGGYGLRIDWENSFNCGGPNNNVQSGKASVTITANEEESIYINWKGIGEKMNEDYEKMELYIDGQLISYGHAPGGGENCIMGEIVGVNNYPNGYPLSVGQHTITIEADTNDELYHTDAYYEFVISNKPITEF